MAQFGGTRGVDVRCGTLTGMGDPRFASALNPRGLEQEGFSRGTFYLPRRAKGKRQTARKGLKTSSGVRHTKVISRGAGSSRRRKESATLTGEHKPKGWDFLVCRFLKGKLGEGKVGSRKRVIRGAHDQ